MTIRIKVDINPDKIMAKRGLSNGDAQRALVHEVRRQMDPYVPLDTGTMKNTAQETEKSIIYDTPYARRQYYENRGRGLRGRQWDKRMMADRRDAIIQFVKDFLGG
jgi:hypothetical protein